MATNIYDLNSPFVSATVPTATVAPAPTKAKRPYWTRVANDALFNGSVMLLICGGIVYLLGVILSATPVGQVMPEQNAWLWLGVVLGGLVLGLVLTIVLVMTAKRALS